MTGAHGDMAIFPNNCGSSDVVFTTIAWVNLPQVKYSK
jgi:hypothetical protein